MTRSLVSSEVAQTEVIKAEAGHHSYDSRDLWAALQREKSKLMTHGQVGPRRPGKHKNWI